MAAKTGTTERKKAPRQTPRQGKASPAQMASAPGAAKAPRQPKMEVFREAHTRTLVDWTPALIRSAEISANSGNLRQAADLWDAIMADDRIQGVTGALVSVVSLPLKFDPEDSEVSVALGGRKGDWWRLLPEPELQELIRWGRGLGVGLGYIKGWNRNEETGNLIADLEVWHPRNLRYDQQLDKWLVRVHGGTEEEVTPGDGRWILYTPYGKRRPWAKGAWRGLSRWWLIKRYAQHDWANYSERQGNGTEVITEELHDQAGIPVPDDEEQATQRRKELTADLKKLRRNSKIVLPPGFKYKLVESVARTWETFKAQKECADQAMAIALVGQNLSSEVSSGSLAAAEVHSKVEGRVIRDVAESISTLAHDQVLPMYIALNYGAGNPVPWPVYDTTPPEDLKAKTEAQKNFAETLIKLEDSGFEVENYVEIGLQLGLKLKRKPKPEPPPTPPPGGDAGEDDNEEPDDQEDQESEDDPETGDE